MHSETAVSEDRAMRRGGPGLRKGESASAMNEEGALRRKRPCLREGEEREERTDMSRMCPHSQQWRHSRGVNAARESFVY